mgnify:CR=1 FL=1
MSKRIVILGAGESGTGAALLAKAKGYKVFVSDAGSIASSYRDELIANQIKFEEGGHDLEKILKADEVIKSPGIPDSVPVMQAIIQNRIPVIGELEFAWRFAKGRFILITGTNGKTTTTLLTHHLLKQAGRNVGLGGNIGTSLARILLDQSYETYVLEVSNFQLEGMSEFKADTAILLNITPDHLDRYYNHFQSYVNAKLKITQNMTENDRFIFFQDDDVISKEVITRGLDVDMLRVSREREVNNGAYFKGGQLFFKNPDGSLAFTISEDEIPLRGPHNMVNVMSAILAAWKEGLTESEIKEGLKSFVNAKHRLEPVGEINGIKFFNDSKATNIDSTFFALSSFHEDIVWIAGGKDKGNDYNTLLPLVQENVKALVCLGADNQKLIQFFSQYLPVEDTHNEVDAVDAALNYANSGDVVVLSPACSSFDLYKNYEDRGDKFRKAVANKISGTHSINQEVES